MEEDVIRKPSDDESLYILADELFALSYEIIQKCFCDLCRKSNRPLAVLVESVNKAKKSFKTMYATGDPQVAFKNEKVIQMLDELISEVRDLEHISSITSDLSKNIFYFLLFPIIHENEEEKLIAWTPRSKEIRERMRYPYNYDQAWEALRKDLEEGITVDRKEERALRSLKNHYVPDLEKIDRAHPEVDRAIGYRSVRYCPIRYGDKELAMLCICSPVLDVAQIFNFIRECSKPHQPPDPILTLLHDPEVKISRFLRLWHDVREAIETRIKEQRAEDWMDMAAGLSHSLTNYSLGITGPLGNLVNAFSKVYSDSEWKCVEEEIRSGNVGKKVEIRKIFNSAVNSIRARKEMNKVIATIGFAREKAQYISMFGAFFEAFAKEARIKRKGIRPISVVQKLNIIDYINQVKEDLIIIERLRWTGAEKIWDQFSLDIKWNEEKSTKQDPFIYYDDLAPLHFTIYELLKNAYLKLFHIYGAEIRQNIIVSLYEIKPIDNIHFERLGIMFKNSCPYTEEYVELFRKLKNGVRISQTGGSGVGIFCCQQFLRGYYYGDLKIDLLPPYKTNSKGKAVFEIIIPRDIREAFYAKA